jgi:hypothetical protein
MEAMGRRRVSSAEERLRVRVLAKEGFSQRDIAERVFGDRNLHGRVERILKQDGEIGSVVDDDPKALLVRLETLAQELKETDLPNLDELTDLYKRRSLQRRLEDAPETVRASELAALFGLELRLEQRRQYERIIGRRGTTSGTRRTRAHESGPR